MLPQIKPATLDDIVITEELFRRASRIPNLQAENQALHTLAGQLVNHPEIMLQNLVDIALDLSQAGSAGVSLLELLPSGEEVFRWVALAGALAYNKGGTAPCHFSPCGICLSRGVPLLYSYPERYFTYFQEAKPQIVETLILPLIASDQALGTLWIVSHDEQRKFDQEDARVMSSLANFTAAALLQKRTVELVIANNALQAEIAERKRVEAALRQSEERYRTLFESIDEGFCVIEMLFNEKDTPVDYRFLEINPAFYEQTGLKEALGKTARQLVPNLENYWFEIYGKVALTGEPLRFENGSEEMNRWFDVYAFRIGEQSSRKVALLFKDISEAKRIEAEREKILQREQTARETAERANKIKDEFLAVLSHELRSPLNPILGWTKLLRTGKLDEAKTVEALATIERNAQLQTQLISDLLDISRIMRGKLMLSEAPVSLSKVIEAALETVRLAAEAKKIQITLTLENNIPQIYGDAGRLQQVIWNLLSNAVKFTPTEGRVEIYLRQANNFAQIQVIDTGKGINPEFLPYVFEHFRQEDSSTTRKFGGLGLGLAIARQITELHGGRIWVKSSGENQGATFTVELPLLNTRAYAYNAETDNLNIP